MYKEQIKVINSQGDPYEKQEMLSKGVEVAKFDFTKIFRNQLFLIFIVFFLSDLLRNIFKCKCSPYSLLMTMYLLGAILCSNVL